VVADNADNAQVATGCLKDSWRPCWIGTTTPTTTAYYSGSCRRDLPRELPTEVVAAVGFRLLGSAFATARTVGSDDWFAKNQTHTVMPVVLDPPLTTREARDHANATLPGVEVRRLTFWRCLLRWQKPTNQAK
jgi:hypothetical protein